MKAINDLSTRQAMLLPTHYSSGMIENISTEFKNLKNLSTNELTYRVGMSSSSLSQRFAAGILLGIMGDPRVNVLDPEMIKIPQACVLMGSSMQEIEEAYQIYNCVGVKKEWLMKEYPQHLVTVREFKIAKFLVTNYEYLIFLKDTNSLDIPFSWKYGTYDPTKANHPVYGISPYAADEYARWLSKKTQRHFRLPTEYEWEYTAGGLNRREFPWGNQFIQECANTLEAKLYMTTPVGMFPKGASEFGCLDMAGNVEEYVSNPYDAYPGGKQIVDDLGARNEYRISRGGSFTRNRDLARSRRRHGFYNKDIYVIGFRLAESI